MLEASSSICPGDTGNPQLEIVAVAVAGSAPTTPAAVLMAKNTPGSRTQAATSAMIATKDSSAIEPQPTMRTSVARAITFGVVPEATSAGNPEIAPQAGVMERNGNS